MNQDKITVAGLKKYLSLFEKSGGYWCCLLLIPGIEVAVSVIDALFYRNIVNAVTASDMVLFRTALWFALLVLIMNMARRLFRFIQMYQIRQIMKRLRLRVMTHLFRMPMSYFEEHHTADFIQKLCFNVEEIKNSLTTTHQQVLNPVIIGGAAIIIILTLDLRIGLMVIVLSVVSVRINMILVKPLRPMSGRIQKALASCTESLTDLLAGIQIIKMFPGARVMVERYERDNADVAAQTMKRFRRMSDVHAVEWVFGFLCNIVILLIGVFMSFAGMVDFGTVVAILSLQGMVSYFLSNIGSAWGALMDSLVLADRVFEILDQPTGQEYGRIGGMDRECLFAVNDRKGLGCVSALNDRKGLGCASAVSGGEDLGCVSALDDRKGLGCLSALNDGKGLGCASVLNNGKERGHSSAVNGGKDREYSSVMNDGEDCGIQISNVIFSYDGSKKVLDGVDITVGRGKTAALIGESGGGKSTVVKLLLGFYQLDGGTIRVLGKQLEDRNAGAAHSNANTCDIPGSARDSQTMISLEELRHNIAYVPQDAYLFATSIRENIRYGRLEASDEEVEEAARRAYAHEFIMSFPNGYDTLVGERGESLSGGQRQRIAIARAFVRNAPILLLDEATSALDSESEQLVQKGIDALMGGRTTLVVAHRLSTIKNADIIYVIEGGKVCEKGRHDELMEQKGVYKRLVELGNAIG